MLNKIVCLSVTLTHS